MGTDAPADITLRTDLRPGDVGAVVFWHGVLYAREHGFDATFEAYVAGPLAEFVRSPSDRQRLWIAGRGGRFAGCIAAVTAAPGVAQIRWFLVAPESRGAGLGGRLLDTVLRFCREQSYRRVILWTVSALTAAARLYRRAGFEKTETNPGRRWGVDVVEEQYELTLR